MKFFFNLLQLLLVFFPNAHSGNSTKSYCEEKLFKNLLFNSDFSQWPKNFHLKFHDDPDSQDRVKAREIFFRNTNSEQKNRVLLSAEKERLAFKTHQQLLALTNREKSKLLNDLKKQYPHFDTIPLFFRIALNDIDSWLELLNETSGQVGYTEAAILSNAGSFAPSLPEKIRTRLIKEIAQKYPTASKYGGGGYGQYQPKRALDAWIRILIPGEKIFEDTYQRTNNPLKSYQAYLDAIEQNLIQNMPNEASKRYGKISAADVLALARVAQRFLVNPKAQFFTIEKNKVPRILFHGSVIKGLAKQGSDLDTFYENITLKYDTISRVRSYPPELENQWAQLAKKRFPFVEFVFDNEPHPFTKGDFIKISKLEPFFIEITPNEINLLVIHRDHELPSHLQIGKYLLK